MVKMMKDIISFFRNKKLKTKLLLSYLLIAILPVGISGFFLVNKTLDSVSEHTEKIYEINSSQISANIRTRLQSFLSMVDSVLYEDLLMKYMEQSYLPDDDYHEKYLKYIELYNSFASKYPIANNPIKLTLYTNNPSIIVDNNFLFNIDQKMTEQAWYKDVYAAKGKIISWGPYEKVNDPYEKKGSLFISIAKLLNPYARNGITKIVRLEIPESEILNLVEKEAENKEIYIIDNRNIIMASTVEKRTGMNCSSIDTLADVIAKQGMQSSKINTPDSIIFYNYINDPTALRGWKVVSIFPTSAMKGDISYIIKYSLLIFVISLIVTTFLIFIFAKTLTKRLNILVKSMSKISAGKFDVSVEISGNDEITDLSNSFNEMAVRINNLINEVYLLDIGKKEAEIHALQSQMNPHFLFNTMESIRMNLWNKQDYETSDIVQKFAKLLRKSIEWGKDKIKLSHEIELVETYLQIQKYRYKDKLDYKINIHKELLDYVIPKFTLQPLAENAIYHGIEMKKGKGTLLLFSELSEDYIKIVIEDDGIGMSEEELVSLKNELADPVFLPGKSRIGIKNIHQRLMLFYGKAYGINLQSRKDLGTRVEITLPVNNIWRD